MPPIEVFTAFRALGIALVLGLLVGFQRQRSQSLVAGVRTFSMVTLFGCCCAIMASAVGGSLSALAPDPPAQIEVATQPETEAPPVTSDAGHIIQPLNEDAGHDESPGQKARPAPLIAPVGSGAWILAAGALVVVTLAVLGNILAMHRGTPNPGMSTEIAMMVMYCVGALAWLTPMEVPAGIGVAVAVLLHAKDALHTFSQRIGEKDVRAVLTFALITFIILPVVPNRTFGPFDVLNPHEAWRMVVLVVGMSLAGYMATKVLGRQGGALAAGLLGGLISSTATAAAAARQSRSAPVPNGETPAHTARRAHALDNLAATMVMLSTTVMYARVLTEIAIVAPSHFSAIAPPVAIVGAITLLAGMAIWIRASRSPAEVPEPENPAALRPAMVFGLLYAGVIFVAAAGTHYLGSAGLLVVAGISGLTDMDAITLSSSRLVEDGRLAAIDASRAILIAATANMVFKTMMIATIGSRGMVRRVALLFGVCALAAVALAVLWPR